MTARRRLRIGCMFTYAAEIPTPAVFMVRPAISRAISTEDGRWLSDPPAPVREYTDIYGNDCARTLLPAGRSQFGFSAVADVPDATGNQITSSSALAGALPPARSELLRLTARRPGISVAEAAQELRLAPNSVSTMVSQLAADGLLARGRAVADGRSVRLSVTDEGAARVGQWRDIRAELAGRALERLPAADRRAISAAVPALARLAEQMEAL